MKFNARFYPENVRGICIDQQYCAYANNEQYAAILDFCRHHQTITEPRLITNLTSIVAGMIADVSDKGLTREAIATQLVKVLTIWFE